MYLSVYLYGLLNSVNNAINFFFSYIFPTVAIRDIKERYEGQLQSDVVFVWASGLTLKKPKAAAVFCGHCPGNATPVGLILSLAFKIKEEKHLFFQSGFRFVHF